MTFNDIFKSSFLSQITGFSLMDMLISLALAFVLGFFVYEIYRKTYRGVMYSRSFGISLMALAMITTLAILTVTSNVVLSLGMVGALSIVRFRTAIKEPMDIVFLFWSIVIGIMLGAGMIPLAVFGSAILGVILLVFTNRTTNEIPYILVLQCENEDAEQQATALVNKAVKRSIVKSKTVNKTGVELTVEIRIVDSAIQFINELSAISGVHNATLVSYNGEYMA